MPYSYLPTQSHRVGIQSIAKLEWPHPAPSGRQLSAGPTLASRSVVALFALLTLSIGPAVLAGEEPSAQASTGASGSATDSNQDQNQLTQIVVTAQRRSEVLLKVSAPVTALTSSDLARQGDVKLADYAATVPGLNLISSVPGQTVVILRGISTGEGAAIAATTATYIDDSPFGATTANALGSFTTLDLDPATVQRVEVLRGPQGTLYGASAMGGLIKYVTIPPSLTQYGGRVELTGSAVDGGGEGYGVRAMFTGPLVTDKLGITVNAFDRLDPGYISDPFQHKTNLNSTDVDGGRLALLWQPTDQLTVDLSVLLQHTVTGGTSYVDVNSNLTPIYGKYEHLRYQRENWDLDNVHYAFRVNYDFAWASLTSISSYQTQTATWVTDLSNRFGPLLSDPTVIGLPNLGVMDNINEKNHKISQEIRLSSPTGNKLEWLGGLFFTTEKSVQPENFQLISTLTGQDLNYPPGVFTDPNHDLYKEYAGYADLTYHFTSKFKILGGIRATSDSESNITLFSGEALNGPPAVAQANVSSKTVTYLVSPSYDINDRNMVYIRVATGFRPGGPTGLTTASVYAGAPSTYGPDTLTNYEVGYKASFPQQRMTLDVSAFDIEWKNIQVLSQTHGFLVTGNGGDARSDGSELAWTWRPIRGLSVSANAAYTDAHLTTDAPALSSVAGDKLPDVPEVSGNFATDYDYPLTAEVEGVVGGNYQYEGARKQDFISGLPAGQVRPGMPAFSSVNLHAGISRGDLTAELFIKNVTNAYGITRLLSELGSGYGAPLSAAVIQPRTFEISISDKF
jgi:outer membrane receptor protein involved in Fe transport